MMKTVVALMIAACASFASAEPDDFATEAYAHYEATNAAQSVRSELTGLINENSALDRSYSDLLIGLSVKSATNALDLAIRAGLDARFAGFGSELQTAFDTRYLRADYSNSVASTYASKTYADSLVTGFLTREQIEEFAASRDWVLGLGYISNGDMISYLASMDYASKSFVADNYVSNAQLAAGDYAAKIWVETYVAEHAADASSTPSSMSGLWDAELEVWWTPIMTNGCLIYKATTNVNMSAVSGE